MPRQVIVWERRLDNDQVQAHLPEASEWIHNRIRDLALAGYLVEEIPSLTVGDLNGDGTRTMVATAVMNTETGKRWILR